MKIAILINVFLYHEKANLSVRNVQLEVATHLKQISELTFQQSYEGRTYVLLYVQEVVKYLATTYLPTI